MYRNDKMSKRRQESKFDHQKDLSFEWRVEKKQSPHCHCIFIGKPLNMSENEICIKHHKQQYKVCVCVCVCVGCLVFGVYLDLFHCFQSGSLTHKIKIKYKTIDSSSLLDVCLFDPIYFDRLFLVRR